MRILSYLIFAFVLLFSRAESFYILRYTTIDNGGILFTGNAMGLSKAAGKNEPGSLDSIGAFITTDLTQKVGNYPSGTTLSWQNNSSNAWLALPPGSTVLYAELIWSGSYGFQNQITGNEPNTPVSITIPNGNTFSVIPDPATSQVALTPGYSNAGNYTRSANVTSIVQAGGLGFYTVKGVPATISALDDTHNAAGWTLAVAFHNGQMPTSNLSIFVGCEQASAASSPPATVSGFCTPASGPLRGNLLISAIEGDANKQGDTMLFGSSLPLTVSANALSGVNNKINNFFASQINTLVNFDGSIFVGSANLDSRGSFGSNNANPFTGQILPGSRQGYDITSVDISDKLVYNQNLAYAKGTTTSDDYTINALAMQIPQGAPTLDIEKKVNGASFVRAEIGDEVTFSFTITNNGTTDAVNSVFIDLLDAGLSYLPGTLIVDGVAIGGDPTVGVPLSTINPEQSINLSFDVSINAYPGSDNVIFNNGSIDYEFLPCMGTLIPLTSNSNEVEIQLPLPHPLLVTKKTVNSQLAIDSSVGNTVLFRIEVTNIGEASALEVMLQDILQEGLELVPGSVNVNGVSLNPSPNPDSIFIGTISIGETAIVEFEALITSYPINAPLYYNSAVVNYFYLEFVDVLTPLDPVNTNMVTINLNVPPVGFEGHIHRCKFLNGTRYCVETTWIDAFSSNVIAYKIYEGQALLETLPPTSNSIKLCNFKKQTEIESLQIRAVYSNQIESAPLPIRIIP